MLQHFHTIYISLDLLSKQKDQNLGNRYVTEVKKTLKIIYENRLKEAIVNIIKEKFSDKSGF